MYPFKTVQKICKFRIHQTFPDSMVSTYLATYSEGFLIKEKVITMDLSTKHFKIFKSRIGTEFELHRCKMTILQ